MTSPPGAGAGATAGATAGAAAVSDPLAPALPGRYGALPGGRYGLRGAVASEWTKLRTVRSTTWTLVVTVVLGIGLGAIVTATTANRWTSMSPLDQATFDPARASLTGIFLAQLAVGVLGVLVVTAEHGTGTIRATFAAVPRRPLVLTAKAIVFGLVALVASEAVSFAAFFLGQGLLVAPATHTTLQAAGVVRVVVGAGLYVTLLGLLALGLGAAIRHTAGAITAFVGILLILPIIVAALPSSIGGPIRRYLPDHIGISLLSTAPQDGTFSPWVGLGVLGGYAAAMLVLGGVVLTRRDA